MPASVRAARWVLVDLILPPQRMACGRQIAGEVALVRVGRTPVDVPVFARVVRAIE